CAQFANDVFPQIDSAYVATGRVQWVFVNLPMPSHTNAWLAAEAALCAGAVSGRFWAMHDRLFAAGIEWSAAANPGPSFTLYAQQAGVAMEAYQTCVAQDRMAPLILQDVIFGSRVTGTPTFLVNNAKTIVGVKSFEEWREILDAELKKEPPRRDQPSR
ncbi:MAG: thioredoxin domain-containing protein, partial [Gemmatimonadota bacterium]